MEVEAEDGSVGVGVTIGGDPGMYVHGGRGSRLVCLFWFGLFERLYCLKVLIKSP